MKPVTTKRDFARRYKIGEFGNRAPTWNTLAEFESDNYQGLVHLRNRVAAGATWYDIPSNEVANKVSQVVSQGLVKIQDLYFSGMAPTSKTLFQCEVTRLIDLHLTYSLLPMTMREALKHQTLYTTNLTAIMLLRRYLDPGALDWLWELLDNYADHTIEFSCYSTHWGTVPHTNTVFWEVRKY